MKWNMDGNENSVRTKQTWTSHGMPSKLSMNESFRFPWKIDKPVYHHISRYVILQHKRTKIICASIYLCISPYIYGLTDPVPAKIDISELWEGRYTRNGTPIYQVHDLPCKSELDKTFSNWHGRVHFSHCLLDMTHEYHDKTNWIA